MQRLGHLSGGVTHSPSCPQVALTCSQIWWTAGVTHALSSIEKGYGNSLKKFHKTQVAQLETLISMLIGQLTPGNRQKIMTICTIDVHARDVVDKMISQKVGFLHSSSSAAGSIILAVFVAIHLSSELFSRANILLFISNLDVLTFFRLRIPRPFLGSPSWDTVGAQMKIIASPTSVMPSFSTPTNTWATHQDWSSLPWQTGMQVTQVQSSLHRLSWFTHLLCLDVTSPWLSPFTCPWAELQQGLQAQGRPRRPKTWAVPLAWWCTCSTVLSRWTTRWVKTCHYKYL